MYTLVSTLAQFDTNYTIFRNVEIFKNYFFPNQKIIYRERKQWIFKNISFVEMNVSKLIN